MYEQNNVSYNWFKIGLRILVVILAVLLSFKIIFIIKENKTNVIEKDEMQEKINLLEKVGKKYFTNDLYPKKVGDSISITLEELIEKELIEEIKDTKGNLCDIKNSYVKVTRLDEEFQMKSYLVCDNFEDYKNSFVTINNTEETTIIKITTTKKVTTKKTTKPLKKYKVSFNTNGGLILDDQVVVENKTLANNVVPERQGYKFVGWFYHGKPFDMNTKINQDYVLVAKWVME